MDITGKNKQCETMRRVLYLNHKPDRRDARIVEELAKTHSMFAQAGLLNFEAINFLQRIFRGQGIDALVTSLPTNAEYLKAAGIKNKDLPGDSGFTALAGKYLGAGGKFEPYKNMRDWDGEGGTSIARSMLFWTRLLTDLAVIIYDETPVPPESLKSAADEVIRKTPDEAGDLRRLEERLTVRAAPSGQTVLSALSDELKIKEHKGYLKALVKVDLGYGLASRQAAGLCGLAQKYPAAIYLEERAEAGSAMECNAKSLMGIMALALGKGAQVTVRVQEGAGAETVLRALCKFLSLNSHEWHAFKEI